MDRILIVEDDREVSQLLSQFLEEKGYAVTCRYDGLSALRALEEKRADLVLLDLMLPYRSGDLVLADIREQSAVPVIVLSAKATTQNKIDLLRLGADDYITKPFDLDEVTARIESNLRRARPGETPRKLRHDELELDLKDNTVCLRGRELSLTAKEMAILTLLMRYPDKVFSKANLFESVWNQPYFSEDNTLTVHISNLRAKMKAMAPEKEYIDTVWGIGYRLHRG